MKTPKIKQDCILQSKRIVPHYNKEIKMTIASKIPDKWLFVDMETGDVWHRREDEFKQVPQDCFWRNATKREIRELRKLRLS